MDHATPHVTAAQQRQALDFMLEALGLQHTSDEVLRGTRGHQLEETVEALLTENRALRMRIRTLEHELHPEEAEIDAFAREVDRRIGGE